MLIKRIIEVVRGKSKKDAFYDFLVKLLGDKPRRKDLYSLAFRHKSASLYVEGRKLNNERLEYLGDAILGAIVSDVLFEKFPTQKEGFLTKLRSRIVSRKQLNQLGKSLGFGEFLLLKGTISDNIFGNCLEAIVGAIYLDFGYVKAKEIVEKRFVQQYIDFEELIKKDENFKSKLVEWTQHNKSKLLFSTDETEKDNRPYFYTKVFIDEVLKGEGEGLSKKQAQQIAAKHTLEQLMRNKQY